MSQRRIEIVRAAIERGEGDARLLDGRDFDALYWRNARRALSNLARELTATARERDAFIAVMSAEPPERPETP